MSQNRKENHIAADFRYKNETFQYNAVQTEGKGTFTILFICRRRGRLRLTFLATDFVSVREKSQYAADKNTAGEARQKKQGKEQKRCEKIHMQNCDTTKSQNKHRAWIVYKTKIEIRPFAT